MTPETQVHSLPRVTSEEEAGGGLRGWELAGNLGCLTLSPRGQQLFHGLHRVPRWGSAPAGRAGRCRWESLYGQKELRQGFRTPSSSPAPQDLTSGAAGATGMEMEGPGPQPNLSPAVWPSPAAWGGICPETRAQVSGKPRMRCGPLDASLRPLGTLRPPPGACSEGPAGRGDTGAWSLEEGEPVGVCRPFGSSGGTGTLWGPRACTDLSEAALSLGHRDSPSLVLCPRAAWPSSTLSGHKVTHSLTLGIKRPAGGPDAAPAAPGTRPAAGTLSFSVRRKWLCRLPVQRKLFLAHRDPELTQRKRQLPRRFGNFPEYKVPATKIPQPRRAQPPAGRRRETTAPAAPGPGARQRRD